VWYLIQVDYQTKNYTVYLPALDTSIKDFKNNKELSKYSRLLIIKRVIRKFIEFVLE